MPDADDTDLAADALSRSRARRPLEPPPRPDTPVPFVIFIGMLGIGLGALLTGVGAGLFAVIGAVIESLGFLVAGVGVVAAGVRLGMQWVDYDRAKRER